MAGVWHIGADEVESLTGLSAGGDYLNSATVTYALTDAAGVAVEVDEVPVTGSYTYTTSSDGDYTAVIQSEVTGVLVDGRKYILEVTIVSGDYDDFRKLERRAQYRGPS
jgi:hypothetical protein